MNTVKPSCLKASVYINFTQTKPANALTPVYTPFSCLQKGVQTRGRGLGMPVGSA